MNVYDFDNTIFYSDSMLRFIGFCLIKHPKLIFTFLPNLIKHFILKKTGKIKASRLRAKINSIVRYLDNPDEDVKLFWDKNEKHIAKWYLDQRKDDDMIITASPEYLLKPIADKYGITLISTVIDKETGTMIGNVRLAKGKAKFIIGLDMPMIHNFYSSTLTDTPLALLAEKSYIVKNKAQTVEPWPHLKEISEQVHSMISA